MENKMLSVKEYAESRGKSVQSVYKQMKGKENSKELEGHIHERKYNGKPVKVLDEVAIEVLDNASMQTIQVIEQNNDKEELELLREENKNLLIKVAELQDLLLKEKDIVRELKDEKIALLEQKTEEPTKKKWSWFWKK